MKRSMLAFLLAIFVMSAPAAAQEPSGTLAQIKKTGTIRIGYRESEPPMSFVGKDKKPAGYSIDVCACIAEAVEKKIGADIKVSYVPVTAENRFNALVNNKIDILCGATTRTLSRSELVDFTQLTFVTGASLMTLEESNARDAGLAGKKIGVVKGSTTVGALKEVLKETATKADVVLFNSAREGVDALRGKTIDAFSADQVVLVGLALKGPEQKDLVIDTSVFSYEPFALAVRRNDAEFRLVADREISALCRSGKITAMYDTWIGQYIGQMPPLFEALIKLNATPE